MMGFQRSKAFVLVSAAIIQGASAFVPPNFLLQKRRFALAAKDPKVPDAISKASWYAVEAFGKIFGRDNTASSSAQTSYSLDQPPATMKETQERLQIDNEREYFLSGEVDKLIYSEDCMFADPFVSFQGRDRFVENLANLGSFITEYTARPLDYRAEGNAVTTKFMVKLQLNLPWKPVLAWPWGVRCEIDPETNLIVLHEESVCNSTRSMLVRTNMFLTPSFLSSMPNTFSGTLSHGRSVAFHEINWRVRSSHLLTTFSSSLRTQGVKQIFRKPTVKVQ